MPFFAQKLHFFCLNVCKFQKFAYLCNRNRETLVANIKTTGAIAQLVEQRTENPCVPGSIPGGTTLKKIKNPDFQVKSGFFIFPIHAKNGSVLRRIYRTQHYRLGVVPVPSRR